MVATRRGGRVSPPAVAKQEEKREAQATPSTGRRTRAAAKQADLPSSTQHALVETCQHLEAALDSPSTSIKKRCSRALRLHSPQQPCTPVGSIHEGDISDVESYCSEKSLVQLPVTPARSRRTQPRPPSQKDEVSDADSCSSVASKPSQSRCRSTKRKLLSDSGDAASGKGATMQKTQRVTRSQRKPPPTRSSTKPPSDDSDLSEPESFASAVSDADGPQSSLRRSTRTRQQIHPIPIHLDEPAERSQSPVGRRPRTARGKAAASADVSEPPSCDSDVFESEAARSVAPRRSLRTRTAAVKVIDSDSELGSRGTPSSSRTGSGTSSRSGVTTRTLLKDVSVDLGEAVEVAEEDKSSMNDSTLESTVITQDAECTLLEEDERQESEVPEVIASDVTLSEAFTNKADLPLISEDSSLIPGSPEAFNEPAMISKDQQEEPPSEDTAAEMEMMQETVPSAEQPEPSVTVTECNRDSDVTAEGKQEAKEEQMEEAEEVEEAVGGEEANLSVEEAEVRAKVEEVGGEEVKMEETEEAEMEEADMGVEEVEVMVDKDETDVEETQMKTEEAEVVEVEEEAEVEEAKEAEEAEVEEVEEDAKEVKEAVEAEVEEKAEEEAEVGQQEMESDPAQVLVQPDTESSAADIRPSVEEKMVVGTLWVEAPQVTELQTESVQAEGQQLEVASEPKSEQPKQASIMSLMDSSDDDEEEEEEEDDDEDEEVSEDTRGESSKSFNSAAASIDGLFMIDTRPGHDADDQYYKAEQEANVASTSKAEQQQEEEEEFVDEEGDEDEDDDDDAAVLFKSRNSQAKSSSRIDAGIRVKDLGGLYISFNCRKSKAVPSSLQKIKEKKLQDEVMKKSVIGPDFEKKEAVPPYSESKQALKLKRKAEREKSTGSGWFDMKAPEVTQELKGDLQVLKMRGSLDPKRFYKKNDRDGFPKYFQVGTVVDSPVDFYHSRIAKKQRKRTIVEELLADAEFRQNNKKKYQHVLAEKAALASGKRHKKKKFHKK